MGSRPKVHRAVLFGVCCSLIEVIFTKCLRRILLAYDSHESLQWKPRFANHTAMSCGSHKYHTPLVAFV